MSNTQRVSKTNEAGGWAGKQITMHVSWKKMENKFDFDLGLSQLLHTELRWLDVSK